VFEREEACWEFIKASLIASTATGSLTLTTLMAAGTGGDEIQRWAVQMWQRLDNGKIRFALFIV
jgi:hypothetical protein